MNYETPRTLITRWGNELDPEHVLPEYPRPQLVRESYQNLNGYWDYAVTDSEQTPDTYDGRILVPFSPEAPLSGVNRQVQPDEWLHYRRTFRLDETVLAGRSGTDSAGHLLLHFGAVDQICSVYVNGQEAGSHTGGYLPFTLDITDLVSEGDNVLTLSVRDFSDASYHTKGKQSLERGGMWYTAQSGIWQTVWLERVPETYITALRMDPDYDGAALGLKILTNTDRSVPARVTVTLHGEQKVSRILYTGKAEKIPLPDFQSWSPENPVLYDLEIRTAEDRVTSYFGMRKVEVKKDARGILRFFLNGRPYLHNGVLDQGYWPDGLYTAPADEAFVHDICEVKKLGFNMLRKHIKIEPDRWYYHCDRLGMLVWQDMVCGGRTYPYWYATIMPSVFPWTARVFRDHNYKRYSRQDRAGREEFLQETRQTICLLYDHPSIVAWVPFNEGWGQFDASRVTALVRKLDPSRLIDEASGWFDQRGGDMYSMHNYFRGIHVRPKKDRVLALTEFGGYSYRDPEHSMFGKVYGYKKFDVPEKLSEALARYWRRQLIPGVKNGMGASVYTQVSDVEEEVNGLLTYDRAEVKVIAGIMEEINREYREAFEKAVNSNKAAGTFRKPLD